MRKVVFLLLAVALLMGCGKEEEKIDQHEAIEGLYHLYRTGREGDDGLFYNDNTRGVYGFRESCMYIYSSGIGVRYRYVKEDTVIDSYDFTWGLKGEVGKDVMIEKMSDTTIFINGYGYEKITDVVDPTKEMLGEWVAEDAKEYHSVSYDNFLNKLKYEEDDMDKHYVITSIGDFPYKPDFFSFYECPIYYNINIGQDGVIIIYSPDYRGDIRTALAYCKNPPFVWYEVVDSKLIVKVLSGSRLWIATYKRVD